jgi:hypothetical protein
MAQHRRRRDRTGSAPVGLRVQDAVHDAVPCLEEVLVVGLVDRHLEAWTLKSFRRRLVYLYGESLMEQTKRRQNDFNAQG